MPSNSRSRAWSSRHPEEGFTLVEMLVVVAILGILGGIAFFSFGGVRGRSVESACKTDYKSIDLAMEAYRTKTGSYPTLAQLKDGSSTILKSYPDETKGYVFGVSGSSITVSGSKVQGTSAAYSGVNACTKK